MFVSGSDEEARALQRAKAEALAGAKAYKTTEHAERVSIVFPTDLNQILQIVGAPEGGIVATLRESVGQALDYARRNDQDGFAPGVMLAMSVEALPPDPREKVLRHKWEYRRPLAGRSQEQLDDLLEKLPAMVQKVTKGGSKIPARLRFGFHYGLVHEFDMPIVMTADQLSKRPAEREAMYKSLERPVSSREKMKEITRLGEEIEAELRTPQDGITCDACLASDTSFCAAHSR